jgi:glycerophosphoryl diester phosphodiesterase
VSTAWHPFLGSEGPLAFVHRGGATEATENSILAFERAWSLGFTHFETDVHATSDGVLVALHDATLDRVTDRVGRIEELPWADVCRSRLADGTSPPRLVELLAAVPGARFNIDVKADEAVGPLIALLRSDPSLLERVCVASFSDARLSVVRRSFGSRVCTSTGPAGVLAHRLAVSLGRPTPGRFLGDCFQVPVGIRRVPLVTEAFVLRAHEQGRPVHVWTVDEQPEMERLLDLGVDGLMTDRPEVLRDVLKARGAWHPPAED